MRELLCRTFDRHPVLIFCLTAFTFSWFWILMSAFWQVGRVNLPFHGDFCIGLARYNLGLTDIDELPDPCVKNGVIGCPVPLSGQKIPETKS